MTNSNIIGHREHIYKSFFSFIVDGNPAENAKENYTKELQKTFKYSNIECDDYSFPSQEFMDDVNKKYQEEKASILELFANGTCLTFHTSEAFLEPSQNLYEKKIKAQQQDKNLIFTNAEFPLQNDNLFVFFSDGTYLTSQRLDKNIFKQFEEIAKRRGYEPKKLQMINDLYYIKKINAYARKIYADKVAETAINSEKEFIKQLFSDNNICYTASNDVLSCDERKYLALFSNGRFIVSDKYRKNKFNRDLANKINAFEQRVLKSKVVFEIEYVPQHYIEAIYKKAEEFDWFFPLDKAKEKIDEEYKKVEEKRPECTKEAMEAFIEKLFKNNNTCLTITNIDELYTTERDEYALFEDNRFIVNEDRQQSAAHRELAYTILKKSGKILIPEYVPAKYLPAIYERALKTQKSAKDIYVEMLKKKAKHLAKSEEITHTQALEKIAALNDFPNWKIVCEIDEDTARVNLGKDTEKDVYIGMFKNGAKELSEKENISIEEARDKYIKGYGFNDWQHLLNASLDTLFRKIKK